ncbi:MAG: ABC transporter permease [Phycisphaerae bacterium]|jgi:putative ABC transport system permease protein|nr:ABC transporter permease [Phycisphaerae bacterium]HPC21344.1 ABC transporter permease [Phycisphaerae bacterium]HRS28017.1 ABC transporter permease [Phycisphaerae bacterium]
MLRLAWANLMHRKLRTTLSVLAVGIGIALLLVSKGLANGSIAEVNQRMQSVDAQLVVLPAQENILFTNGAPFPGVFERLLARQADEHGPLATAVIPVFFAQVRMGGQQQRVFGVDPRQMSLFLGSRRVLEGRAFDQAFSMAEKTAELRRPTTQIVEAESLPPEILEAGLELIIDDRLRRVGEFDAASGTNRPYRIGDEIRIMSRGFRIVGVVETGVAGRVFAPIQTLREILNGGEPWSTMFFVKLRPDLDPVVAADHFQSVLGQQARVELKSEYGKLLHESFAQVNMYMTASSGLALVVCFLFILLTMYTMVLERTREIGILKALGMTRLSLLSLSISEALVVSSSGALIGIGLAYGARYVLNVLRPLLTVELPLSMLAVALGLAVIGGGLSALYPGYRAARLEPAVALTCE